jgi:sugar-specific transcriptional regulator TrmB
MTTQIKKYLKELGFNDKEITVYIALTQLGEAGASTIAKKADLPRTTVISILQKLGKENYISIHRYHGRNIFWIESPKMIKQTFEQKVVIADELDSLLTDLYSSESDFPHAQIYDTKSSITSFVEELIIKTQKGSTIYTIDNPKSGNYRKILSETFYYNMLNIKVDNCITTKTLIPHNTLKTIDTQKIIDRHIEIKEMPKNITFEASFWIIENTLVLFSGKYPFIVAVNHKIITHSFQSIFNYLWSVSE